MDTNTCPIRTGRNLKAAVLGEVRRLRKLSTPCEQARLDVETFSPYSGEKCIYGQLFGWAYSARAREVKQQASPYRMKEYWGDIYGFIRFAADADPELPERDTPLEYYIVRHPNDNGAILNYLRGGQHTLTLTLNDDYQ